MLKNLLKFIVIFCCLNNKSKALTIRDVPAEDDMELTTASPITQSNYRTSVAKVQETHYRVPEHLQFVPKGFVYEDADDVIHVIDPPKQFEELKKIMQQQKRPNLRPIALREQRPKPKIIKTIMQAKHKGVPIQRKPSTEMDLQTQESQHLPLEILASVRKTENYLKKYKPKLPSVKQRLKTQKIQTVIVEQQQVQQQYQQGLGQRIQGIREQQTANRRHHLNKKRFKRDTQSHERTPLKGEQLLNHISELIKSASSYLQQTENNEDYHDTDLESTTLQGEIIVQTSKTPSENSGLNEDVVVKILENSVKATNVIMQQLKRQTNLTTITEKCDYLKVTYPNHIQNLQNQIKCMQNFIKAINPIEQHEQKQLNKKYGDHLELRRTKELRHKPFLVAQLAEDYIDDSAPTPVNSSLIYNDVMTTIRNMLQSQNLQSIDDTANRFFYGGEDSLSDNSPEPVNFHNLNEYLKSLEAIVTNLPKFNHKSLNLQEIEGGSNSKYYFINPQGTIYSLPQPFQKDIPSTAPTTIFHQFPDLPIVREYLKNGTLIPPSSKVIEIL